MAARRRLGSVTTTRDPFKPRRDSNGTAAFLQLSCDFSGRPGQSTSSNQGKRVRDDAATILRERCIRRVGRAASCGAGGDGAERQIRPARAQCQRADRSQGLTGNATSASAVRPDRRATIAPSDRRRAGRAVMDVGGKLVTPGRSTCTATRIRTDRRSASRPTSWSAPSARRRLVRRRCRRQQLRRLPPLRRAGVADAPVRVRPTSAWSGWRAFRSPELYNIEYASPLCAPSLRRRTCASASRWIPVARR